MDTQGTHQLRLLEKKINERHRSAQHHVLPRIKESENTSTSAAGNFGEGSYECSAPLLIDLGVPPSEIVAFDEPRNTEEEARRIKEEFGEDAKIVLVTSAWHMRRSLLLFRRAGLDVIPSAADREMSLRRGLPLEFKEFLPDANALLRNSYATKEWVAYFGYRWLRGR
jgi:uncharacterized SAM-binding protein YcdF (DUF218 family)